MTAPVAVVIPYYRNQSGLTRLLDALDAQTLPPCEVAVADDGSPEPPDVGGRAIRVLRQADLGFRAAAARNLGARATSSELLAFLDADMLPAPDYLARVAEAVDSGADLVVGARRHVDLTGLGDREVGAWLRGTPGAPEPVRLGDPRWLADGYAATRDLRDADDRSYRYVISAVLSVRREIFERAGGFDETFTAYGGEDWELAHRCWLAGATFAHQPAAIAWHDGPEPAERADGPDATATKNREILELARRLPDPRLRTPGIVWPVPRIAVELDDRGVDVSLVVLTAADLLRTPDTGVWLADGAALREGAWPADDRRVRIGPVPPELARSVPWRVRCRAGVRLLGRSLAEVLRDGPARYGSLLEVRSTRADHRGEPAAERSNAPGPTARDTVADWLQWGSETPDLEAVWGWEGRWPGFDSIEESQG